MHSFIYCSICTRHKAFFSEMTGGLASESSGNVACDAPKCPCWCPQETADSSPNQATDSLSPSAILGMAVRSAIAAA